MAAFPLLALVGLAQAQSVSATAHAGKVVTLTAGWCAQVSDGDVLVFEWNPAFDHPWNVAGIDRTSLTFAKRGQEDQVLAGQGGIRLMAMHAGRGNAPHGAATVVDLPNGYSRATFRLHLANVDPGEYVLVAAGASARTSSRDDVPRMTNSPVDSPFCLDVVPATQ